MVERNAHTISSVVAVPQNLDPAYNKEHMPLATLTILGRNIIAELEELNRRNRLGAVSDR